ncbi:MAG: carboxypeptidase-like regulatory domain-containing protein [Pyrinomonadaceae bacterium]|nr:carboxypeptidase-like regulatory domain-containing protein [Pyrinomonadaceae bacterium]
MFTTPCLAQGTCNIKTFRIERVKGQVVYKVHDEIVANASVELRRHGGDEALISSTETDARGTFEILNVRPGTYWLFAWKSPHLLKYAVKLNVVRSGKGTRSMKPILIKLGASPLEPCGGGDATWLH